MSGSERLLAEAHQKKGHALAEERCGRAKSKERMIGTVLHFLNVFMLQCVYFLTEPRAMVRKNTRSLSRIENCIMRMAR